jgi:hypothetical protein
MKALLRIAVLVFILFATYACAKKDTTTSSSSTSTNANPQPTVTNFSVNGVASNAPNPSTDTIGGNFIVEATDANGYPKIQIKFLGKTAPISGPYSIYGSASGAFQCSFMLTTATSSTVTPTIVSTASSGIVNISAAATPNNSATFSNIVCTNTGTATTTYTVTGTIKY